MLYNNNGNKGSKGPLLIGIAAIVLIVGLCLLLNNGKQPVKTSASSISEPSALTTAESSADKAASSQALDAETSDYSQAELAEAVLVAPASEAQEATISEPDRTSYTGNSTSPKLSSNTVSSSNALFTNKYGTPSTKCAHTGCNRVIASSGDTNCCTIHSKKCAECGKYIDEDATYCMDCITKAATGNKSQQSSSGFSNKYGTSTTKCAHIGCNNPIASTGDTNCCTVHSNRCLNCGKYIDEDAVYCMDCLTKAVTDTKTTSSSSSSKSGSFSNAYGTATTKCAHPGCNNSIASSGDTNCCSIHSNRCLECGKLIDGDAMYCMSCLSKALSPSSSKPSGSSGSKSSGSSSSGSLDFSGYSDSMSDAEFDAWLDNVLGF